MGQSAEKIEAPPTGAARWARPGTERRPISNPTTVSVLVAADVGAVLVAYFAAFLVRIWLPVPLTSELLPPSQVDVPHEALLIGLLTQVPLLYFFGLYDLPLIRHRVRWMIAPALALLVQLLVITGWYFFRVEPLFPRSVLLLYTMINLGLVIGIRLSARHLLALGARPLRVALVGPRDGVVELAEILRERSSSGHPIDVVCAVWSDGPAALASGPDDQGLLWLDGPRELEGLTEEGAIDQVILVPAESRRDDPLDRVLGWTGGERPPQVAVVPSMHELRVGRLASLNIDDVPMIEVTREPRLSVSYAAKTVLDYGLATALLLVALPICAISAIAIAVTSPGPVFYRQRRVGRDGQEFMMYKLRTMRVNAEDETGPVLARSGDERVTVVGRFLRATRIDEIPQLLNVLNGTMSLIGPRPERPEFVEELVHEIPGYRERWLVKPGLSGLAQVRGEYHTSPAYKLKYDLAYIHNHSLLLDLQIMAETVKALLTRRGV